MTTISNPNLLPPVSVSATQRMQHNNAFGGNAVSITYGVGNNGWTSVSGSEIEVWGQGYVDLLARRGSTGLKYTFSGTLEAGVYYLKWSARGRWAEDTTGNPAENEYNVQIADSSGIVNLGVFEANVIEPSEGAENFGMFFELSEPRAISIAFIPTGTGTRGPLVGIDPVLEKVEIEVVQTNYPEGIVGNSDNETSYSERIIADGEIAWITGQPEAANLVARLKCSSLKNWSLSLSIRSERRERNTTDDRDKRFENLEVSSVDITTEECIGGKFTLTVTNLVSQEDVSFLVFPKIEFKVRGRNPMDSVVRAYIDETVGNEFPYAWAIAVKETLASNTIYNQFNSREGNNNYLGKPNYGSPDGWGISQIDGRGQGRTITTAEVYNWQVNIASMLPVLRSKKGEEFSLRKNAAKSFYGNAWIEMPETYELNGYVINVIDLTTIVLYNGAGGCPLYGSYGFPWKIENGVWVFKDNQTGYGAKVCKILSAGTTAYDE
ncbi:MAG: hypothetical protein K6B46_03315 [Opitutales bacterium]|nr:hypothetical protein [Opitutales bacterium]